MNPAIRDSPDTEQYARNRMRELLEGTCNLQQLMDELPRVCADSPEAGWALLALIDQHLRRGQLDVHLFHAVKTPLQRQLLGLSGVPAAGDALPFLPQRLPIPPQRLPIPPAQHLVSRVPTLAISAATALPPAVLAAHWHPASAGRHRASWLLLWCALIGTTAAVLQRTHWFPGVAVSVSATSLLTAAATAPAAGLATHAAATTPSARSEPAPSATSAPPVIPWATAPRAITVTRTLGVPAPPAGYVARSGTNISAAVAPATSATSLTSSATSAAALDPPAGTTPPQRQRPTEPAPLRLSASAYTVSAGQDVAAITVQRVADHRGTIHFVWWTASDSAQSGLDFSAPPMSSASLPDGVNAMAFTIPIHADTARSGELRFYVMIGIPGDTPARMARATVLIKPPARSAASADAAGAASRTQARAALRRRTGGV